jgi:hypothetical protein
MHGNDQNFGYDCLLIPEFRFGSTGPFSQAFLKRLERKILGSGVVKRRNACAQEG